MAKVLITDTDPLGYPFIVDDDDEAALVKPDYQQNLLVANTALKAHDTAIAAAQQAAASSVQPSDLAAHANDTTAIHGIADTAALETQTGAQAKADIALAAAAAQLNTALGLAPIKGPGRVAVLSNVNIASPGATLDSLSMNTNDRILLFGQTDGTQNGLYAYNGASSALTRTSDADTSTEMKPGLIVAISEGTYADKLFELQTDAPITLGTTVLTFGLASGGGSSSPLIAYNGSTYSPRNTVTSSATTPVLWVGPVQPTVGGGYMIAGVDNWLYTTEVS